MKKHLILIASLLIAANVHAQNIYGDMEVWRNVNTPLDPTILQSPRGWFNTDSIIFMAKFIYPTAQFYQQAYRTTDTHGGNSAEKLATRAQGPFGIIPGILTNTQPDIPPTGSTTPVFNGGLFINSRISGVTAWVKYFPKGTDIAVAEIKAIIMGGGTGGTDSVVGVSKVFITAADSNYTFITIPAIYENDTVQPDYIQLFFQSSGSNPQDSSTLFIDDINILTPNGLPILQHEYTVSCYPDPANHFINFHFAQKQNRHLFIYNIKGETVAQSTIASDTRVDVSGFTNGLYFFRLENSLDKTTETGRFIIER